MPEKIERRSKNGGERLHGGNRGDEKGETSQMRSSEWLTWTKIIDLNISFLWGLLEVGNN